MSESYFLNNEMMGIEMGAQISNLSKPIDIRYTKVNKVQETTFKIYDLDELIIIVMVRMRPFIFLFHSHTDGKCSLL